MKPFYFEYTTYHGEGEFSKYKGIIFATSDDEAYEYLQLKNPGSEVRVWDTISTTDT